MVTAAPGRATRMTTDAPKRTVSLFAKAEAGSRQLVLQIGLGMVSLIVGSILAAGATPRIGERLGPMESESMAWALGWVLQRLWLFAVLPLFGAVIGRFTEITPLRFALTAGLAGEIFSLLLTAGINGFDYLLGDPKEVIAQVLTLFVGLAITMSAVMAGQSAAAEGQAEADVIAQKRKAEYAEFLAAAEGKGAGAPPEPAPAPIGATPGAPSGAAPPTDPQNPPSSAPADSEPKPPSVA